MTFKKLKKKIVINIRSDKKKTIKELYSKTESRQAYITLQASKYLKIKYPHLEITKYEYQEVPKKKMKNYIYSLIITKPASNHPFVVYANIKSNIIHIINPFGKEEEDGQISLNQFEKLLQDKYKDKIDIYLYYGFYLLFGESIKIRKMQLLLDEKYSLLKCSNIKQCRINVNKINKKRISLSLKKKEIKKANKFYEEKAKKFIKKYYDLLDEKNFTEAYNFLKVKKGKYFKKQRLDTFFVKSKKLIGHLQILIDIYQFVFLIVDRFKYYIKQ